MKEGEAQATRPELIAQSNTGFCAGFVRAGNAPTSLRHAYRPNLTDVAFERWDRGREELRLKPSQWALIECRRLVNIEVRQLVGAVDRSERAERGTERGRQRPLQPVRLAVLAQLGPSPEHRQQRRKRRTLHTGSAERVTRNRFDRLSKDAHAAHQSRWSEIGQLGDVARVPRVRDRVGARVRRLHGACHRVHILRNKRSRVPVVMAEEVRTDQSNLLLEFSFSNVCPEPVLATVKSSFLVSQLRGREGSPHLSCRGS